MQKIVFLSRFIAASFLASCAFDASAAEVPSAPVARESGIDAERREALKALLQAPANRGMEIHLSKKTGVPEFLVRGEQPLARASQHNDENRTRTALEYVAREKSLFRLRDPENELRLARDFSDGTGRQHYVFQQHVDGVPVRGAELRAHFDAGDALYAITNHSLPSIENVTVEPAITPDDALRVAREQFRETALEQEAPLLELRVIEGRHRLVYTVATLVNVVNRWQSIIDARNGEVLRHFKDHQDGSVAGYGIDLAGKGHSFQAWERTSRYHLVDVTVPVHGGREDPLVKVREYGDTYVMDMLNSEGESSETVASRSPDSGWDPAGISALTNGQAAYRYFRDTHGRQGINGRNSSLLFSIHYGESYDNAFWNGKWMVFGDGGRRFSNLAQCLDIVGHEMSHGVISTTANLEYENESGALNESIADVFGVLMEGRNWTIGEDCTKVAAGFIRDMSNPANGLRRQPAHMSDYYVSPNTEEGDWGGVHVNSGIPNRAAYLLAEGLTKEGLGISIGRDRTGKLYYRALTVYLSPLSKFIDLRRALLLAAADLHRGDTAVTAAIHDAFDATGITEGTSRAGGVLDVGTSGQLASGVTTLNFGDVDTGATKSLSLLLSNNTDRAVDIHDVGISGSGFAHTFTNSRIAPGDTLKGTVTFNGLAEPGTRLATLEIFTDGNPDNGDSPQTVDLVVTVRKDAAAKIDGSQAASGGGAAGWWLLLLMPLAVLRRRPESSMATQARGTFSG